MIDSKEKPEATKLGELSPEARALIERRRQTARPSTALGPTPRDASVTQLPLSFEQQSLWFIDRLSPGVAAYHIPVALRVIGSFDVSSLRSALDALVIRHESLRSTFDLADGMPIQVVGSPRPVPFREADLSTCPDDQARERTPTHPRRGGQAPFRPVTRHHAARCCRPTGRSGTRTATRDTSYRRRWVVDRHPVARTC